MTFDSEEGGIKQKGQEKEEKGGKKPQLDVQEMERWP